MDFIAHLWLPIVVSAVLVFVASSVIHMVVQWHKTDYNKLANEDDVRAALRASDAAPAQYVMPYCPGMKDMQAPEMQKKFVEGPIAFITLRPIGVPKMGGALGSVVRLHARHQRDRGLRRVEGVGADGDRRELPPGMPPGGRARLPRLRRGQRAARHLDGQAPGAAWPRTSPTRAIYAAITAVTFAWLWPR